MTSSGFHSPYEDDPEIAGEIVVYRAVNPRFVLWDQLDSKGMPHMQSNVFSDLSDQAAAERGYPAPAMSVALSHALSEQDETPERMLELYFDSTWGIAAIKVEDIRSITPGVGVRIWPEPDAPWHGIVFAKTRKHLRVEKGLIRDLAVLVRAPDEHY